MNFSWRWTDAGNVDAKSVKYAGTATATWSKTARCKDDLTEDVDFTLKSTNPNTKDFVDMAEIGAFAKGTRHGKCDAHVSAYLSVHQGGPKGRKMIFYIPDVRLISLLVRKRNPTARALLLMIGTPTTFFLSSQLLIL